MLINRVGGGSENLKVELTEQESLLAQIQEILPFKGAVGLDYGVVELESDVTNFTVEHKLGEKPVTTVLIRDDINVYPYTLAKSNNQTICRSANSTIVIGTTSNTLSETTIQFKSNSSYPFKAGKYYWFATL